MENTMDKIAQESFKDELQKIANMHHQGVSSMYMPVAYASKGATTGAVLGGGVSGLTAYKLMNVLKNKHPNNKLISSLSMPIISAALLAGGLYGGDIGGKVGTGYGGSEKILSHLD